MTLTIGSLFSGIGGLELGLEWAGLGPVLWQVERDPFCRRKLSWRYPDAARHTDVRAVGASNLAPVDLICGGFPCQDISAAGKRAGLSGSRSGLWHEFARIVAECRPRWVVVENVASNATEWVDPVRGALERLGYATLPIPIEAGDCGAPHERARVFVVGHAAHGHDAQRPAAEVKSDATDAHSTGLREQQGRGGGAPWQGACEPAKDGAHADDDACQLHALLDEGGDGARHDAARHRGWTAEPALARVVHGFPGRMDYERALGNAVVPQCAEVVGHVIQRLREARHV